MRFLFRILISGIPFIPLVGTAQILHKPIAEEKLENVHYIKHDIVRDFDVPPGCRLLALAAGNRVIKIKKWDKKGIRLVSTIAIDSTILDSLTDSQLANALQLHAYTGADSVFIDLGNAAFNNPDILVDGRTRGITGSPGGRGKDPARTISISGGAPSGSGDSTSSRTLGILPTKQVYTRRDLERMMRSVGGDEATLYIPAGIAVSISANDCIVKGIADLPAVKLNGNNNYFAFANVDTLISHSNFSDVYVRNMNCAAVDIQNGSFIAGDIDSLTIRSKMSHVDARHVGRLYLKTSTSDSYLIDDLGFIKGAKEFGSFRAGILHIGADMDCSNADIIIKEIAATAGQLTIRDRYAAIYLGFVDPGHASISLRGGYSTILAPADVVLTRLDDKEKPPIVLSANTAVVPPGSGKPTLVQINCVACSVNIQ